MKYYTLAAAALLGAVLAGDDKPAEDKDKKTDDAGKEEEAPAAATGCAIKFEFFSDEACTTAAEKDNDAVKTAWEKTAKAADGKCTAVKDSDPATYSKTTCDGTGLTAGVYSDAECTKLTKDKDGKEVAATTVGWGACTKASDKTSFKLTGAKTLMVAATAALALVGSQF